MVFVPAAGAKIVIGTNKWSAAIKTISTNVEVALELGSGYRLEKFEVHARKSQHCS